MINFTAKYYINPKKYFMRKELYSLLFMGLMAAAPMNAQTKSLHQLQQEFEDLRFGMFTHFALGTYQEADWANPETPLSVIDAPKLDCNQWAEAAQSAKMSYGCLSVKHHNGLCMWATRTTDYNIMNSALGRDVVKEYCEAFRKKGMKVMFHFSILDVHHDLRPHKITSAHIEMTKRQISELLTNYGEVTAIMFDGWEAPWGRISYDDIPFTDIYTLVKSLQPNCLVIDMNSHKYPREELFYSDIKFYEQGAGQKISTDENHLPAMACLPMQRTWFWKESMPTDELLSPENFVKNTLEPYNKAHCSFVLNAAPNRDGLIDDNAVAVLKKIGHLWTDTERYSVPECAAPIVQKNIALNRPCNSSWSDDTALMDLANDDNFSSAWCSHPSIENPYWEVELGQQQAFDMIVVTEPRGGILQEYRLEYRENGVWKTIFFGEVPTQSRVKTHRFATVKGDRVRITVTKSNGAPSIAELGVYQPL